MVYSQNWDLADSFTIAQAAYLWCEQEPQLDYHLIAHTAPPDVRATFAALHNGAVTGVLRSVGGLRSFDDYKGAVVTRAELADFARAKKQAPKFLFDTVLTASEISSPPKEKGGRPAKHDWNSCYYEVVRMANTPDGLPERAILIEHLKKWFAERFDAEPAQSDLYNKISPIYAYLEKDQA